MRKYWLCPLTQLSPLQIGSERVECVSDSELVAFRELLARIHPRLLPGFKSHLLISDEEGMCGIPEEFDLASSDSIVVDEDNRSLSHCAHSFIDRLLSPQQVIYELDRCQHTLDGEQVSQQHQHWLMHMKQWAQLKWHIILLIEENS